MKIGTWNVNGIRARHAQVQEWVERERPDVVCLQEIKAAPEQIPLLLCELPGVLVLLARGQRVSGVALHVSKSFAPDRPAFSHPSFDYEHRIVSVDLHTATGPITVASIYVPNGGKDFPAKMRFLEAMEAYTREFSASGRTLIACGDLNVALTDKDVHPKERKPRAIGQLPEERALLGRVIGEGLVDLGRAVDPDNEGLFTWWAPWRSMRQRNIGWRLDYVLVSTALATKALSCVVQTAVGTSDHAPVVAAFET